MSVKNRQMGIGVCAAALLASGTALSEVSDRGSIGTGQALVALPEEKSQARDELLDQLFASLTSVDAAYTSANPAQAQAKFEEARSSWNQISPAIWTRQAQAIQLLFDSLAPNSNAARRQRR